MRLLTFIGILALAVCVSCGQKEKNITYSLSDEQLANLMLDLQFADAALGEVNGLQRDSLQDILWVEIEKIYMHPVKELEEEVRKLESDPEKLNLVMDRVQVLLDSIR